MKAMDFALQAALDERALSHLYRKRLTHTGPQKPFLQVGGEPLLAFCSNDYLGLAADPQVVSALTKAAHEYGCGGGASHLVCGHSQAHHRLEEELAEFAGRERALLFSNGYMANMGVITALTQASDAIFQDKLNHASLIDGGLLSRAKFNRYPHLNYDLLEKRLMRSEANRKLVVSDGVFSMDGDTADINRLSHVCQSHNAWLMIDDAHGFGCLGENGGGVAELYGASQENVPILIGTLGKAFGTSGAFVVGSNALIETLIQFARTYIYTTSLSPAIAEATRVSLSLIQTQGWRRQQLRALIAYFKNGCQALNLPLMPSSTPIQPLHVGCSQQALKISDALRQKGILVTAIRPPTVPDGQSRLRVTLTALHDFTHLDQLLDALSDLGSLFVEPMERES